jgi:phosphatidylserine decarboxylase
MKFPVVAEGWKYILPALAAGVFLLYWETRTIKPWLSVAGVSMMLLAALLLNFFRDPGRKPERVLQDGEVLCPADGVIVALGEVQEPLHLKGMAFQAAVFMNVFNCHVQRAPFDGKVLKRAYYPGKFMAANIEKASLDNEQSHLVVELNWKKGKKMVVKQIAGLLARRVVTDAKEGDVLVRGERIGRILMGSRVDVFLPKGFKPYVKLGDPVRAGETVLGVLP